MVMPRIRWSSSARNRPSPTAPSSGMRDVDMSRTSPSGTGWAPFPGLSRERSCAWLSGESELISSRRSVPRLAERQSDWGAGGGGISAPKPGAAPLAGAGGGGGRLSRPEAECAAMGGAGEEVGRGIAVHRDEGGIAAAAEAVHRLGEERLARSEERRVGKECRSRWSPY